MLKIISLRENRHVFLLLIAPFNKLITKPDGTASADTIFQLWAGCMGEIVKSNQNGRDRNS